MTLEIIRVQLLIPSLAVAAGLMSLPGIVYLTERGNGVTRGQTGQR
jgi:hypothetical protein